MTQPLIGRRLIILLAFSMFSAAPIGGSENETRLAPSRDRTLSELHHTSWTARDGIPGSVNALAQTPDGYLWLGTGNGLWRFDGTRFERYEPESNQIFPSHVVETLMATPDGGLFIGFRDAGAAFLKNQITTVYPTLGGKQMGTVRHFARAQDGVVWAAAYSGLFRLVDSQWRQVGQDWGYPWSRAQTVFVDRGGTLWVAGDNSIVFLPPGEKRFQETAEHVVDRPFEVNSIVQAPDGTIWMGETTRSVRPIMIRQPEKKAPHPPQITVGSYGLLFDDAGSLWIASLGDGLGRIRFPEQLNGRGVLNFPNAAEIFSQKEGLSADHVMPVLEDREGNVWVGTGAGLDRFQQSNVVLSAIPAGSDDMILIPGDHGDVWTASLNRPFSHIEGRLVIKKQSESVMATTCGYRDGDGSFWPGGPAGIQHVVKAGS